MFFIGADDGNLPKPLKGNPLASCANSLRLFILISSAQPSPAGPYPYCNQKNTRKACFLLERMTGIGPATTAWEAVVLPLNYIRIFNL